MSDASQPPETKRKPRYNGLHPGGRPPIHPSAYDDAAINIMFDQMVAGVGLTEACQDPRCPAYHEVYRRIHRDPEFAKRVLDARETQQQAMVDQTYVIANSATPENWQVARLRMQAIWWGAARLSPKMFGDKSQLNLVVTDALSDRLTAALKRQRELAASGVVEIEGVAEPVEALPAPDDKD
jgi:hypothetical protein